MIIKTQAYLQGYLHEKTAAPYDVPAPPETHGYQPLTPQEVDDLSFKTKEEALRAKSDIKAYLQSQRDAELGAPWGKPAYSPYLKSQLGKPPLHQQSGILSRDLAEKIRMRRLGEDSMREGSMGYYNPVNTVGEALDYRHIPPRITINTAPRFKEEEAGTIAHEADHVRKFGKTRIAQVLNSLRSGFYDEYNQLSPNINRKARELDWSRDYTAYHDTPDEQEARAAAHAWARTRNLPGEHRATDRYDALSDTVDPQWYKDMFKNQGAVQADLELARRNRFHRWMKPRYEDRELLSRILGPGTVKGGAHPRRVQEPMSESEQSRLEDVYRQRQQVRDTKPPAGA